MAAVESITRNLEAEDEAVRKNIEQCEAELFDAGSANLEAAEDDSTMRIMAARDVYVNPPAQPTPTAAGMPGADTGTATGSALPAASADTPWWKTAAKLAVIMAATGGTGAGLTAYLMQPAVEKAAEAIVPPGYGVEVEKGPAF